MTRPISVLVKRLEFMAWSNRPTSLKVVALGRGHGLLVRAQLPASTCGTRGSVHPMMAASMEATFRWPAAVVLLPQEPPEEPTHGRGSGQISPRQLGDVHERKFRYRLEAATQAGGCHLEVELVQTFNMSAQKNHVGHCYKMDPKSLGRCRIIAITLCLGMDCVRALDGLCAPICHMQCHYDDTNVAVASRHQRRRDDAR